MNMTRKEGKLTVTLEGRLDTITAPSLTEAITGETFTALTVDVENLEYISSAGLRALLVCKKTADEQGAPMVLRKPNAAVFEVMRMSGFNKMLQISED